MVVWRWCGGAEDLCFGTRQASVNPGAPLHQLSSQVVSPLSLLLPSCEAGDRHLLPGSAWAVQ